MDSDRGQSAHFNIQVSETREGVSMNGEITRPPHDGSGLRTTVRFSPDEYERLTNDKRVTGMSIPGLLKRTYFKGPPLSPLMCPEDQRTALTELRRIGTNINQIAKHLNSGFREGWYEEFVQVRDNVAWLRQFITGFSGNH